MSESNITLYVIPLEVAVLIHPNNLGMCNTLLFLMQRNLAILTTNICLI